MSYSIRKTFVGTSLFSALAVLFSGMSSLDGSEQESEKQIVMENQYLKLAVSPVGGRILSFVDKLRDREEAKVLPYVGGVNEVRFNNSLPIDEVKTPYDLKLETLADGTQKLTATTKVPNASRPEAEDVVRKEYILRPDSASVQIAIEIENHGKAEIGLFPWVRHLLNRNLKEATEKAFMTEYGAFLSSKPSPLQRDQKANTEGHFFPADGWTSRVILPTEEGSNTFVSMIAPGSMFKVYNWSRSHENFGTQELIAAPLFVPGGETRRLEYIIAVTAPIHNVTYASPDLIIGVSPHPTWIPADTRSLALDFSSPRELSGISVQAKLVPVDNPDAVLKEFEFQLPKLSPKDVTRKDIPVELQEGKGYQLLLTFKKDGQVFQPGAAFEQETPVVLPLVVGEPREAIKVFASRTREHGRIREIEPRVIPAKLVAISPDFEAFGVPTASRFFSKDTFETKDKGALSLHAAAGEYESAQVVLLPKISKPVTFSVEGTTLTGPDGGVVPCESVNQFIYVETRTPSLYNAFYPIGNYPEALLPTNEIKLEPGSNFPLFITYRVPPDAKPGQYRGAVKLRQGEREFEIPVEMTVWNFQIPLRSSSMEIASSLKGVTIPEARHADGTVFSPKEQLDAIVDMHLKYRLTPCDSGMANLLLNGQRAEFEVEMERFVKGGATKIFLGQIPVLLKGYADSIPGIEAYLKEKGWIDYFYVRPGFDEASPDLVPDILKTAKQWKEVSSIPVMETYYPDERAEELFGALDIWSRNYPRPAWTEQRTAAGDKLWKVNAMPGVMEVEPWDSGRKRYVIMWDNHFTGSYIWTVKSWSNVTKWGEDYWADSGVGNLAAVLMWPHESGILSTIRLEAMRDGLEDNAMLWMLREKVASLKGITLKDPAQAKALDDARQLCEEGPLAPKLNSAEDVNQLHLRVGNALSILAGVPTQKP